LHRLDVIMREIGRQGQGAPVVVAGPFRSVQRSGAVSRFASFSTASVNSAPGRCSFVSLLVFLIAIITFCNFTILLSNLLATFLFELPVLQVIAADFRRLLINFV
jgi:hypothetical protein